MLLLVWFNKGTILGDIACLMSTVTSEYRNRERAERWATQQHKGQQRLEATPPVNHHLDYGKN